MLTSAAKYEDLELVFVRYREILGSFSGSLFLRFKYASDRVH